VEIILVAAIGSDLFSISSTGQAVPFTGDAGDLVPFIEAARLKESLNFMLFDGIFADPLSVDIFVAYRTEQGELIYTPAPFSIVINSANVHRSSDTSLSNQ